MPATAPAVGRGVGVLLLGLAAVLATIRLAKVDVARALFVFAFLAVHRGYPCWR